MTTALGRFGRRYVFTAVLLTSVSALAIGTASARGVPALPLPSQVHFTLTVLHNNDGESSLVAAGTGTLADFGGVARFKTLMDQLRDEATAKPPPGPARGVRRGVLTISSGDNFLAGPAFTASFQKGVPFYDSIALKAVGYDALVIGNHEFDFGPDVFADFIDGFDGTTVFLSANLDVSAEPRLALLRDAGIVVPSTSTRIKGEWIGIVGATTPRLATISSPRNVTVLQNVAEVVQAEVDAMTAQGINKVIFVSHLQSLAEDRALIQQLRDVDVAIAGGGDELLANCERRPKDGVDTCGELLVPDGTVTAGPYPLYENDAAGQPVPIVTTTGNYKYVGRLVVDFDRHGRVVNIRDSSGPVRVSGVGGDAVAPDPFVQAMVVEPVATYEAALAANVLANSAVDLDGRRAPGVRTMETNLGNLMADSMLWSAQSRAASFGAPTPVVAFQNGGGIRLSAVLNAGPFTELNTFQIAPFSNFVSIVPDVERSRIKEILENAVSRVEFEDGRFAQVAGLAFDYDPVKLPQLTAVTGEITQAGERVRDVVLDDGTVIVENGAVVPGDPVTIATIDFLARGGDQYPLSDLEFINVGITYQQMLAGYLTGPLAGSITKTAYPVGGEGRITRLE